ncbi:MAG: DNA repair protein RecO [Candidatus Sericytochromatia bacterium]|uniref:DNA repair protein RecO n=1 Tax=Candidatus Tanganyikabacteria bacterium TaxID=2961651 RepID=A0A937X6W2_9BACT|nr:DNA repair protein RecO [Candidatus Tanganyikabacteria bacterium]
MSGSEALCAVNLRAYPLGESDKILVVFSRERGILRLAARGARKTGNKWAGRLEPLARNVLQVIRGRGSLEQLIGADTRVSGAGLLGDLDRLMVGLRFAEVVMALLPEAEPYPEVFAALETALDLLVDRVSPAVVSLWFELTILDLAGYRPEFGEHTLAQRLLAALQEAEPRLLHGVEAPAEIALEASEILANTISRHAETEIHAADLMKRLSAPLGAQKESLNGVEALGAPGAPVSSAAAASLDPPPGADEETL